MSFFVKVHSPKRMRIWLAEASGTFMLVFAGTGAIIVNDLTNGSITQVGIALTFGLVVMALIYAMGDISGAHFNPAVTLGFWSAGRMPGREVVPYLISQAMGAGAASFTLSLLFDHRTLGATIPAGPLTQSFVLEAITTAFLMFVILSVSKGRRESGMIAGVAVGAVIAMEAMFAGPISGASMNPARSLAPAFLSGQLHGWWIYLIAPVFGSLAGSMWFGVLRGDPWNSYNTMKG